MVQISQHYAERSFQTAEAAGCISELYVFFFRRVRSVVGYDCINSTVQNCFAHCLYVIPAAERRGNAGCRIVGCASFIGQGQVVNGNFTGYVYAFCFVLTDDIDCTFTCYVSNVYMCAGVFCDDAVTSYSDIFGYSGDARYADTCGYSTFVHVAVHIQFRVNCMANEAFVKCSNIFCSQHEESGAFYIVAVIGECHGATECHIAHFSKFVTAGAFADCADNFNVSVAFFSSTLFDCGNNCSVINYGFGVRHAGYSSYTASSSSFGTADNVFFCFQAGFT